MEERIVAPDPVTQPQEYQQALLDLLGDQDPVEVMAQTPRTFARLTTGLDDEALHKPPEPGEWSLEQLLAHLYSAEIVYAFRWRLTLAQPETTYPGYDQDIWVTLPHPPFARMLEAFQVLRGVDVELIRATPKSEWGKVCHHVERGPESFGMAVQLLAGHDIAHLKQLEQTAAAVR
jgi:hypothetical protein